MGELILCNKYIAAMPYYIEHISLNIYSIEELCYYLVNNAYLLEKDFMSDELCTWIGKELDMESLAEQLKEMIYKNAPLSDFVKAILCSCPYCDKNQMEHVLGLLQELEQKSDFECNKLRADRLMEKEKYLSSIYEYKHLLDSEAAKDENPVLVGNIWHNLGSAYARLFLFAEASRCFANAYEKNGNEESLKEELFAYRCMHDESSYIRVARENHIDEEMMTQLRNELSAISRGENVLRFEEALDKLKALLLDGNRLGFQKEISSIILQWKEDYRRISRV